MATKKVNIDIIARDKSKQALNNARTGLDRLKSSIFNVRNALVGLGGGVAIRSLIKTGIEIENLQVRLKFLFGTAEEGAKAFDEMAKFASKVPFSLEEIQQGAGVLAIISKDAQELSKNMELTGNVAAVSGLDFKTASEQIQRALSSGIGAADLFREKGVTAMLGFKAGAKVTVEETAEAFERVFGASGQFAGSTTALAQTFSGTLSMIGDKFFNFKRTILEAGFFPELKAQFKDLDNFLQNNTKSLDDIAISLGKGLAEAVRVGADAIVFIKDNFNLLVDTLQFLITLKVASIFMGLASAIGVANGAMLLFNATIKRNLFIAGAAIVVSQFDKIQTALGKLKGDFDNVSDALEQNNLLIEHYQNELDTANGVLKMFENQVGVTKEQLKEYQDIVDDATKKLKALKKTNSELNAVQNEHLRVTNAVTQAITEENNANNEKDKIQKKLIETGGILDNDLKDLFPTLLAHKEHIDAVSEAYANQEHALDPILDALRLEEQQLKKTMEAYAEYGMQRRRISLQAFRDEREQAKNNQQKMFDDALESESKIVAMKESTKQLTIEKGRELISELAKNNKEMFMINKALAIKDAIMSTAQGISKALALGPFGIPLAGIIGGLGAVQIATIARQEYSGRQLGGSVKKGEPYIVGESGREMFVPNENGKIVPNHDLQQGVNVNFNINTVDARGFNELLVNSRGVIINMINSAVNEKGRQAII